MTDLEETLGNFELEEADAEERIQFYKLMDQMWLSEQIPVNRMQKLMQQFSRFSNYMKNR